MRQFHHQVWRPKMPSLILTPLSFVVALFIVITSAEDGRHFVKSEDLSIQPTLNLEPLKYDIELEIMKGGQLVFGKVYIAVKFKSPKTPIENIFSDVNRSIGGWSFRSDPAPRDRIILHKTRWLEIVPDSIKVEAAKTFEELDIGGGGALVDVPIKRAIKQSKDVVVIELTKNMPLDAYGQISFRYKSTKNPTLYHGTIFDPITNQYNRFIANRLENSSEARHLFPCFSDPQFKTKIRLRLTIPAESGLDVVSNMPVQGTDIFQMGFDIAPIMYHTPVFEITSAAIPLSSLVFVLGHYEQRRYWYKEQLMNYAKVALYEPSGHKGEGVYAYEFAIKAIAWFQEHFELESTGLSLNEIKLVAVPSYKAWKISDGHGVALIDHDLLLIDEKISSPQRKIEAALNVAHAVARQWFSHTVRPQSEEDAWITDGLALHTALRMVDNIEPEFKINQYVLDRHYRRIVFMMVEDEDRELSPRDRVFLEQLTGKSVFDVLQANIVQTDESHFDKIIRKLVVATLKKGISQPKLVDAFGSEGVTKEEINKIIKAKRTFSPLGKRLHVDLTSGEDHQSVTITQPQDETSVVLWPVKMKLRLSSHDGTQTESFNVPLDEFENGRQIIEMKLPEWFRSSEDNWLKVDLGDGQILPYHQLHYSERIIARLGKQIETGNLLTPSERIDILSQQLNTVGVISGVQGHKNVDELIKLIGYYKKEKDPDVLLEVLDAIEWALHWWRDTDSLHSLKIELKEIYKSLNGLKVAGDETISKKRAKSEAALILMLRFFNDETERDAVKAYEQYIYKTPAFLRSAVFQGVHLHGVDNVESRDISQKLAARLDTASLPEERFRIKNVDSSSY